MSRSVVRMSVRAVVEFSIHDSDLAPAAGAAKRMREGAAAHKARQSGQMRERADYRAETALAADYDAGEFTLRVAGRADGLLEREDGTPIVEEIKLGAADSPLHPAHRAQAAMYAHMLAEKEALRAVCLRVLYVGEDGEPLAQYEEECCAQALAETFSALCAAAARWEGEKLRRRQARDASLSALPFPYAQFRPGQKRFAQNVFVALRERKRLFAQAPTGIGKTMAALYPALRALGAGHCGRVVFLTARTTGRESAMDALSRLAEGGAAVRAVEIAAKDKLCPREKRDCRPEVCPLAAGFYDRLPAALAEALDLRVCGRDRIAALAGKHALCPFELALEMAKLADAVVCDYNYVFDPFVSIDALLQTLGGAALLVDEAHQLAPRVRDALSGAASADDMRRIRRESGKSAGRKGGLYAALTGAIRALDALAGTEEFASGRLEAPPEALGKAMRLVREAAAAQLAQRPDPASADAFALAGGYLYAAERFDGRYAALTSGEGKHGTVEICCLSAAQEIAERTKRAHGAVYFSATLAPFEAAKLALGSGEGDACLRLPSPFDKEQLRASVFPADIRYAARERTAPAVAEAIGRHLTENEGSALVFFPSYAYLNRIWEIIEGTEGMSGRTLLRERRGMTEEEKGEMLRAMRAGENAALFAVLGGAFSEGIDLPGDALRSVAVVSTGMPQPDARTRAMQAYYDAQGEDGFFLTMTLPGMIRVIQAAGRLIRTETDTGALLLIDQRFRTRRVQEILSGTLIGDALGI